MASTLKRVPPTVRDGRKAEPVELSQLRGHLVLPILNIATGLFLGVMTGCAGPGEHAPHDGAAQAIGTSSSAALTADAQATSSFHTCTTPADCPSGVCFNFGTSRGCVTSCVADADCATPQGTCIEWSNLGPAVRFCHPNRRAAALNRPAEVVSGDVQSVASGPTTSASSTSGPRR